MEEDKDTTENESLKDISNSTSSSWGGARPNAGRPRGSENEETRKKRVVEEEFRQRVLRSAQKLISSQMNLAEGTQMLFRIDTETDEKGNTKKSKPILVTSQEEIESYLAGEFEDEDEKYYFITTERPDNRALDSLFDRVFGKSVNNIDVTSDGKQLPQPLLYGIFDNNSNKEDSSPDKED